MKRFKSRGKTLLAACGIWLWLPSHLAVASDAGNLFVSDWVANTIYEYTPGGTRSTFASGLNRPTGLACNSSGDLFEADGGSGNIYEYTPGGTRSTFASGLNDPDELAFNAAGNLFEADWADGYIYEFTPGGTRSTFASGLCEPPGNPEGPRGLAFDANGNLFVAWNGEPGYTIINKFTPGGSQSTFYVGILNLAYPGGLAFNSSGTLFAADWEWGEIDEFTPSAAESTFVSGLSFPNDLAFNSSGTLFEADQGNGSGNVYEFTPGGARTTFASGLEAPYGLAFAPTPTPEPSALALVGVGAICLLGYAWRRRSATTILRLLFAAALLASAVSAQANVFNMGGTRNPTTGTWAGLASLSFVTVGDPGNVADPSTGYGAVPYVYQMGTYDVTTAQYVAFLNSVATKSDPYGLYNSGMALGASLPGGGIGITQTAVIGVPGISYSYSVTGSAPDATNMPMFNVTWGDAARFCNWLDNSRPTSGTEAAGTTETGAYTLNGDVLSLMETRNAGATYFIPSENEWYKAAYYSGGGTNSAYYTYPTNSNIAPGNVLPDTGNTPTTGTTVTRIRRTS